MFTSLSWQDFFITIFIILGCYYTITILLLFNNEIISFFKGRRFNRSEGTRKEQVDKTYELMGGIRYERNSKQNDYLAEVVNADDLNVVMPPSEEEVLHSVDEEMEELNYHFIVIEGEIKSLAGIASLSRKTESIPLFKTLLSNYPQFIGTEFQGKISQLIYDSCKRGDQHYFSLEEINAWWKEQDENV